MTNPSDEVNRVRRKARSICTPELEITRISIYCWAVTPGRWLAGGAWAALLLFVLVSVAVLGLAERVWKGARVTITAVTGNAAAAVGDSGVFASPLLPPNVLPAIPHADAESAAVAMGYWGVPSFQDLTALPEYKERYLERRHFCGRSYYVRPVVAMPDTNVVRANSGNAWGMWSPTWVMPICDDANRVRTSVEFSDVPQRLRVIQGDRPGDVPELVPAAGTFPHIGQWPWRYFPDWERGIGMTPETAVDVAVTWLRGTGARVAEVPEAFTIIMPLNSWRRPKGDSTPFAPTAQCARWRLTLDRPVLLRGTSSHQVIRTRTVYAVRGEGGCRGNLILEIPKPSQPATVPFMYMVPALPGHPPLTRDPELRWTTLRVVEPIWFEPARPVR